MVAQKLVHLLEAFVKRPETELVKAGVLDLVDGYELLTVVRVAAEKAGFASQSCGLLAFRINADVQYLAGFVLLE